MKKICILFCGGTMTMKRNSEGALSPHYSGKELLNRVPQLQSIAEVSSEEIANVDSSNIDPTTWTTLAHSIYERYEIYDGFVVTHGTDTMAYTASALSFALQNAQKSIIFTGAQKPLEHIPSDALSNLVNATLVASRYSLGVAVVFGSKIVQGNRSTKTSESSLDAFDSPMVPALGSISLEPEIRGPQLKNNGNNLQFLPIFDPNVLVLKIFPGLPIQYIEENIIQKYHGVILEAFGAGNIPQTLLPFLQNAQKNHAPVVILSQCQRGVTKMQLYDVGNQALKAGAIPGGDMTTEAAVTKLMWVLSQTRDIHTIKQLFEANIAGEMTVYGK